MSVSWDSQRRCVKASIDGEVIELPLQEAATIGRLFLFAVEQGEADIERD